jgi:tRNA A-37 threonylcarbamoyl transferase component Bud32
MVAGGILMPIPVSHSFFDTLAMAMGIYSLLEGKTLGGRYRVDRLLGKGGMGAVFSATDLHLNRGIAVKVIALESSTAEQAAMLRARFRREAHIAARLQHPNVITLHDYGTDEALGLDFIVMELLSGEDIQTRIRTTGPFVWRRATRILYEAASGLGAGHRVGLIHRDVKSANLFLENGPDGNWLRTLVLDFGIAQLKSDATGTVTHLTVFGQAPLSPPYASPEQLRGDRELTPAADVYQLGVTAFEMLSGALPFGETERATLARGVLIRPPSLSSMDARIPAAVDELIGRALSPNPRDRPQDGDAFAREIRAARRAGEAARSPRRVAEVPPPEPVLLVRPVAVPAPVASPARRRGRTRGAALVASGAAALAAVLVLWGSGRVRAATEDPEPKALAEAPTAPPLPATAAEIASVRETYLAIEKDAPLFSERRIAVNELFAEEWPRVDDAYATVYDHEWVVRKIRLRVSRGNVRTSLLFYYYAGRVVFVQEAQSTSGRDANLEHRFYFAKRDRRPMAAPTMIRWLGPDGAEVPVESPVFAERARSLLAIADNLYMKAIRKYG